MKGKKKMSEEDKNEGREVANRLLEHAEPQTDKTYLDPDVQFQEQAEKTKNEMKRISGRDD